MTKDFVTNQPVRIQNCPGLDGRTGIVVGKNVDLGILCMYIILLDGSITDKEGFCHRAVSIPSTLLESLQ